MDFGLYALIAIVVLAIIFVKMAVVIIPQSETRIIERLGKYYATLKIQEAINMDRAMRSMVHMTDL